MIFNLRLCHGSIKVWDGRRYLKACYEKQFELKRGLTVTLNKPGDDSLSVKSITIDTKSPDKKNKETERFQCGPFELKGTKTIESLACKTRKSKDFATNSSYI